MKKIIKITSIFVLFFFFAFKVNAANLESRIYLENDIQNKNYFQNELVTLTGWNLQVGGTDYMHIYLDGVFYQEVNLILREDVDKANPLYESGSGSGFEFNIDTAFLKKGSHIISFNIVSYDGTVCNNTYTFYVEKLPPKLFVETPLLNQDFKGSDIVIEGWTIHQSGLDYVHMYLDGDFLCSSKIAREDVAQIYPNYKDSRQSGFSCSISADKLTRGSHTVTIYSVSNDGEKISISRTFIIQKLAPKINVETSLNLANFAASQNISVAGWTLHSSGLDYVQIFVDGQFFDNATIGTRNDVNNAFPGYASGEKSGFTYTIPAGTLSKGSHSILIYSIAKDSEVIYSKQNIVIERKDSRLNVETLNSNMIINNQNINVEGWFINELGTSKIEIYLDNSLFGNSILNISRPDVNKVFPGYSQVDNGGFSYNIDVNKLAPGNHNLLLKATTLDNETITKSYQITIVKPSSLISLENLKNDQTIYNSIFELNGWALNASGIEDLHFYIDGVFVGSAKTTITRNDVNHAFPGYTGGEEAGFIINFNLSNFKMGTHHLTMYAIGNDGTALSRTVMFKYGGSVIFIDTKLTLESVALKEYHKGAMISSVNGWISASYNEVMFYMDPRNWQDHDIYKYIFMKLAYHNGISVNDLNKILLGKGVLEGQGAAFLEAGRLHNVNPIYLVAHAILETGNGTSSLSKYYITQTYNNSCIVTSTLESGIYVYNVYGINAIDACPISAGSSRAYEKGWTTVESAIIGGAEFIANSYIARKQDTLYKMRYNISNIYHEYATDVAWAIKQASTIKKYVEQLEESNIVFEIPIYN